MTITLTEEIQATPKRGRGALPKEDPTIWEKVGLSTSEWAQAQLYFPGGKPTDIVREMLDTCKLWRPEGKAEKPKAGTPLKPRRTPAIAREARRRGMETAELENEMWALYKAQQKETGK